MCTEGGGGSFLPCGVFRGVQTPPFALCNVQFDLADRLFSPCLSPVSSEDQDFFFFFFFFGGGLVSVFHRNMRTFFMLVSSKISPPPPPPLKSLGTPLLLDIPGLYCRSSPPVMSHEFSKCNLYPLFFIIEPHFPIHRTVQMRLESGLHT